MDTLFTCISGTATRLAHHSGLAHVLHTPRTCLAHASWASHSSQALHTHLTRLINLTCLAHVSHLAHVLHVLLTSQRPHTRLAHASQASHAPQTQHTPCTRLPCASQRPRTRVIHLTRLAHAPPASPHASHTCPTPRTHDGRSTCIAHASDLLDMPVLEQHTCATAVLHTPSLMHPCVPLGSCTLHMHGRLVARPFCTPIMLPPLAHGLHTYDMCCTPSARKACKPRAHLAHPGAGTLHDQGSHLAHLLCSNCGATAHALQPPCTPLARPSHNP